LLARLYTLGLSAIGILIAMMMMTTSVMAASVMATAAAMVFRTLPLLLIAGLTLPLLLGASLSLAFQALTSSHGNLSPLMMFPSVVTTAASASVMMMGMFFCRGRGSLASKALTGHLSIGTLGLALMMITTAAAVMAAMMTAATSVMFLSLAI